MYLLLSHLVAVTLRLGSQVIKLAGRLGPVLQCRLYYYSGMGRLTGQETMPWRRWLVTLHSQERRTRHSMGATRGGTRLHQETAGEGQQWAGVSLGLSWEGGGEAGKQA